MMRNKVVLWIVILTIALMGINACAIPVHFSDGPRSIRAVAAVEALSALDAEEDGADDAQDEDEEAPEEEAGDEIPEGAPISVQDFHLLSRLDDDRFLIFADGGYYAATEAEMRDILAQLDAASVEALPDYDDLKPIKLKSRGADVKALQSALVAEGYLTGGADGSFGRKSQEAVSAFQEAMGLEATGEADALLQLLILSAQQEGVNILSEYDPIMRYAAIKDSTAANLATAAELGLELDYDDISGIGTLYNDAVVVIDGSGASDIDSYEFTLQFVLKVTQKAPDAVTIKPAVEVSCVCLRRPIMQELTLKSGDLRCTLPISDLKNALVGVMSEETGTAALSEEAVKLLLNAAEAGELKLRIGCKYGTFDGEAEPEQLEAVSDIGKAAAGL